MKTAVCADFLGSGLGGRADWEAENAHEGVKVIKTSDNVIRLTPIRILFRQRNRGRCDS
jgi:hypothetical protein